MKGEFTMPRKSPHPPPPDPDRPVPPHRPTGLPNPRPQQAARWQRTKRYGWDSR